AAPARPRAATLRADRSSPGARSAEPAPSLPSSRLPARRPRSPCRSRKYLSPMVPSLTSDTYPRHVRTNVPGDEKRASGLRESTCGESREQQLPERFEGGLDGLGDPLGGVRRVMQPGRRGPERARPAGVDARELAP